MKEFAAAFDEALRSVSSEGCGEESYDGELDLSRVDMQLLADIRAAGPYGVGFPEPRFLVKDALVQRPRPVGASHMAFSLMQRGASVDAIAFDSAHLPLRDGSEISCLVSLQLNEFAGRSRLQLRIHGLW